MGFAAAGAGAVGFAAAGAGAVGFAAGAGVVAGLTEPGEEPLPLLPPLPDPPALPAPGVVGNVKTEEFCPVVLALPCSSI